MAARHLALVLGSTGVAAAAALALATSSPASGSGTAFLTENQILNIANLAAAAAGDRTPTSIQHSQGSRAQANIIASGEIVSGAQDSILIVERGHFVANDAPRPAGAAAPSGSVLTLVVDATSGQVTDTGIQDNVPDLAALGPVSTDLGGLASTASTRHARKARPKGVLTGAIIFVGGPAPAHARTPSAGLVSVFDAAGRAIARQHVRKGHHFRFVLTPGHHKLNAGRELHPKHGCQPRSAQVRKSRTTHINVETGCNIP